MKSKTIKEAAARCRAAWKRAPRARYAWCCHHRQRYERVWEPPERRIRYILNYKPIQEQIVRLDNFRPVQCPVPKPINKHFVKTVQFINRLKKQEVKAARVLNRIQLKIAKARTFRNEIANWNKPFTCISRAAIERWHNRDVPGNAWDAVRNRLAGTAH